MQGTLNVGTFPHSVAFDGANIWVTNAKGKAIGRTKATVNTAQIARLRKAGASWREIAKSTGLSIGTVYAPRSKRAPVSAPVTA